MRTQMVIPSDIPTWISELLKNANSPINNLFTFLNIVINKLINTYSFRCTSHLCYRPQVSQHCLFRNNFLRKKNKKFVRAT